MFELSASCLNCHLGAGGRERARGWKGALMFELSTSCLKCRLGDGGFTHGKDWRARKRPAQGLRKPFEAAPSALPARILAPLWGATVPKQSRLVGPLQKHAKSRSIWAPAQNMQKQSQ